MVDRSTVIVAAREIADYLYRCARVAGCDAGSAKRLAANVAHSEASGSGGLEAVLKVAEVSDRELRRLAQVANLVDSAEVRARGVGHSLVAFDMAVPLGALSLTLEQARGRGITVSFVGEEACLLEGVELRSGVAAVEPGSESGVSSGPQLDGIVVGRSTWTRLQALASRYLVPEVALDEEP